MGLEAHKVRAEEEGEVFRVRGTLSDGTAVDRELFVGFDGPDGICWLGDGPDPVEPGDEEAGWDEVLLALDRRVEWPAGRCDPACPGWFINDETRKVERCDVCCAGTDLTDEEAAQLPDARAALAALPPEEP